jgi:hypothetical protein
MIIKSSLTKAQYINASLVLRYSRIGTRIILVFGGLFLAFTIYSEIESPGFAGGIEFIFPFFILVVPAIRAYYSASMNFKSNPRLTEPILYTFSDDHLTIKGESYMTQFTWDKVYKVTQTKNWIFIWQNRLIANPISRQDISTDQVQELRAILAMRGVKNNL